MDCRTARRSPRQTRPAKIAGSGGASHLPAALRCRCPRCGQGKLFRGYLETIDRCEICDLPLGAIDDGDGPAFFLILILGFAVVPLAIWMSNVVDLPDWAQGLFWGVVILGLTVGMLRPAKALILALNYRNRPQV